MNLYQQKLEALTEIAKAHPGTGGQRALISILGDLDGHGPIGELLHTLDRHNFARVIDLFVEFKKTGRSVNFNDLHFKTKLVMKELE